MRANGGWERAEVN